jgi:hypothetical protein
MEVRRARAVRRGLGERLDDLQLLDHHRAAPAARCDQRQRVLVLQMDMYKGDVQPVDFSDEIRRGAGLCLDRASVAGTR